MLGSSHLHPGALREDSARAGTARVCPYCGGSSDWLLASHDINRRIDATSFDYYRCSTCGLVFLWDPPTDLGRYYAGGYQPLPKSLRRLRSMARRERYRLEPILPFQRAGALLEVGPWIGLFSCNAKDAGFDVTAIEMDERCVHFLSNVVGIKAIQSSDPAVTIAGMSRDFEVIALWHSIEHIPRPWEVLRRAAEHLSRDGILVVSAPNPESFQFRTLRERWLHLDAPRHVNLLPISLLERIGAESGLELAWSTTDDALSHLLSTNAWGAYVGSFIPIPYVRYLVKLAVVPLVSRVFAARQRTSQQGAGYTVILRKV
jgi:SAM-dependent methyltransferase